MTHRTNAMAIAGVLEHPPTVITNHPTQHFIMVSQRRLHQPCITFPAFADPDPDAGLRKAQRLAAELDRTHPDAAGSLRERLDEMFTVRRLGIDGTLARTLVCTNMIESMISICRTTSRNVKRWRDDGDMRRRWCAAGLLAAERKFRRLRGHRQMPDLVAALAPHAQAVTPTCDTDHNNLAA
jgi:hypothetical protein